LIQILAVDAGCILNYTETANKLFSSRVKTLGGILFLTRCLLVVRSRS